MLNRQNKQKVKSIFLGRKVRKYWEMKKWYSERPVLEESTETLERVKVLEKKMDFEFNVNDEIYLDELGVYTKIQKKTKDTNGNIIYNITYVTEALEDYDEEIKKEYEKVFAEWEIKDKQERIECEKRKEEENKKYEEFKAKKDKVEKKNTIVFEIPKNENGRLILDLETTRKIQREMEMNLPMDCRVVITPFMVGMYDGEDKIIVNKDIEK